MNERMSGRLRSGVAALILATSFVAGEAWAEPKAPESTVEPYFQARIFYIPAAVNVDLLLGRNPELATDLDSQVPVTGLRTYIDLTDHGSLEFIGDYGG